MERPSKDLTGREEKVREMIPTPDQNMKDPKYDELN